MSFPSRNSSLNVSFPQSTPASDTHHNAPSIISSRMTDIVSEDGDEYHPEGAAAAAARSKTMATPGGQSDLIHPQSPQRDNWNRSPPSRRGAFIQGSSGSWRPGNAFGGPGVTMSNTSRPQSATSRSSKTHVPSLTSHAFFRPMSSQRLQAQRSGRPLGQTGAPNTANSDVASTTNRQSLGSNPTGQIGYHDVDIPPPSRGTDFTEQDPRDRASVNPSQSVDESTRPLHRRTSLARPTHNETSPVHKHSPEGNQRVGTFIGSFGSGFLSPASGHSGVSPPQNTAQNHERLSSDATSPKSEHANVMPAAKTQIGHNYQYHLGNTIFFLGGRFQNTRDRPINVATGILVVLPAILFLVYSGPYFWHNVSPAIPIFFAYIFFICISSFVHASVTDPGILPRNLHPLPPENSDDPLAIGPSLTEWTLIRSAGSTSAAMEVPTKYCKTCNIWRPPRAHHCRICNNCVETQDHHCVWLNNCVGRRNYRYFFTFVSFGTVLGIFLTFGSLGHCLRYQSTEDISFRQSIDVWRVPFAMFLYGILITPYPSSLTAYHLFLMGRGETTREYLNSHKFLVKDRHRPFTQGTFLRNWIVVLMRPRPPTYLRFKDRYTEGDQRFGARKVKRQGPSVAEQQASGVEMENVVGAASSFHGSSMNGGQRQQSL